MKKPRHGNSVSEGRNQDIKVPQEKEEIKTWNLRRREKGPRNWNFKRKRRKPRHEIWGDEGGYQDQVQEEKEGIKTWKLRRRGRRSRKFQWCKVSLRVTQPAHQAQQVSKSWSLGFSKVCPHLDSLPREVLPAHHQPKLHQRRWTTFATDIKTLSVLQWKFYDTLTIHFRHHRSMKVDGGDQWPLVSQAAAEWLGEEEEEPLAQTWPHQCNTKLESWWYQSWRLVLAAQIYWRNPSRAKQQGGESRAAEKVRDEVAGEANAEPWVCWIFIGCWVSTHFDFSFRREAAGVSILIPDLEHLPK